MSTQSNRIGTRAEKIEAIAAEAREALATAARLSGELRDMFGESLPILPREDAPLSVTTAALAEVCAEAAALSDVCDAAREVAGSVAALAGEARVRLGQAKRLTAAACAALDSDAVGPR